MGPARWQVMRVVWCLEALKRSSLAVHRLGWAGRAAVTCSPFFTLILGRGRRPSVSRRVPDYGPNEEQLKGLQAPASRLASLTPVGTSCSPSSHPQGPHLDARHATQLSPAPKDPSTQRPAAPSVKSNPGIEALQDLLWFRLGL